MNKSIILLSVAICIVLCFIKISDCAVTIEQMKTSANMVRSVCQPKYKLSDDLINGITDGKFPDNKDLKCYVHCVMEMMGMMKKAKINYDASLKQIEILLPDDLKEPNRNALNMCKDSTNGMKEPCEAAWLMVQCLQKNNPQFMFA